MTEKFFPRVMLTGHRPKALSNDEQAWAQTQILRTLKRLKAFHGVNEVISGMALGADTWWAQAALDLEIPLAAYIPFEAQKDVWPPHAQAIWQDIRSKATREVVVGESFSVRLLHARNDAMIRDADLCVALWKKSTTSGGTYSAVQKIRKLRKPLIVLDPETETVISERL